jgi:hypothetical protein
MSIITNKKTSFYIDGDNKEKMKKMVPERKQSEFINNAVRSALREIEKQQIASLAIEAIDNCPLFKSKKNAAKLIREIRDERSERISKIFNKK